ncbi:MAG: peptidoglycan-binding protein [Cyanobacteriota bacterium]|nr:peptidoglycan-binding protein [Cyanobacteriota bacterium]
MSTKHTTLMLNDGISVPQLKDEVKELQHLLKGLGLLLDDAGSPAIDGLFGRVTQEAVRVFQGRRALEVDGIVGPRTWAGLLGVDVDEIEVLPRPGISFGTRFPTGRGSAALKTHLEEIARRGYEPFIKAAAAEFNLQPSLLGGVGSRESFWGLILNPPGPAGTGDNGHGRGLMQIDDGAFPTWIATGEWKDPARNILFGAKVLADNRRFFEAKIPGSGSLLIRATVASYNAGPGNVIESIRAGRDVDSRTTGGDYSRDVLDRAGWFQTFASWD